MAGDTKTQAEGAAQQIKGKAEKVIGNVKDAVRDAKTDADRERERKARKSASTRTAAPGIQRTANQNQPIELQDQHRYTAQA